MEIRRNIIERLKDWMIPVDVFNAFLFSLKTVFDADFYIKLIFIDADFCKIFIIFAPDIYIIKDCYEIPAKKHRL